MNDFTNNGLLEKNLRSLYDSLVLDKNKDLTLTVVGPPGSAKSALSFLLGHWFDANFEKVEFDFEKSTSFLHDQWINAEKNELEKYWFSWYDEGRNTFDRRKAMHNENKEGLDHLNMFRFKHLVRIINFQNPVSMEPELLFSRSDAVVRCVKQGWAWGYSMKTMKKAKIVETEHGKKLKWPDPDFRFAFPNPEEKYPEKWEEYEKINEQKLNPDEEEDEDELSPQQMVELVKKRQDYFTRTYNKREFIDKELIEMEYDVGRKKAAKVKKVVEAQLGLPRKKD